MRDNIPPDSMWEPSDNVTLCCIWHPVVSSRHPLAFFGEIICAFQHQFHREWCLPWTGSPCCPGIWRFWIVVPKHVAWFPVVWQGCQAGEHWWVHRPKQHAFETNRCRSIDLSRSLHFVVALRQFPMLFATKGLSALISFPFRCFQGGKPQPQ